jgi:hypothetical protein
VKQLQRALCIQSSASSATDLVVMELWDELIGNVRKYIPALIHSSSQQRNDVRMQEEVNLCCMKLFPKVNGGITNAATCLCRRLRGQHMRRRAVVMKWSWGRLPA